MDTARLGRTELELSRLGLGCGNFGGIGSAPELFGCGETKEEAFALMDAALAAGITFFDTAPSYGGGRSESCVGEWHEERGAPVLLSSKVYWSVTGDSKDRGLSRGRILREIEGNVGVRSCISAAARGGRGPVSSQTAEPKNSAPPVSGGAP